MNPRAARFLLACAAVFILIEQTSVPRLVAEQGPQRTAFVTVVAEKGPMKNLTAKDFVAYEDNSKREVLSADLSGDPLSVFLIVDTSAPQFGVNPPTQDLRRALTTFVKTLRLTGGNVDVALCQSSNAAVRGVDFGKSVDLDTAISRITPEQAPSSVILEALNDAGKALKNRPMPRRAIVSLDFDSPEASSEKEMKPAEQSVHDAGATLWAVSVRNSKTSLVDTANQRASLVNASREAVLNDITNANGGMRWTVLDTSSLENALVVVANTVASQYAVTFAHPGGNPKKTRFETTSGAKVLLSPFMR